MNTDLDSAIWLDSEAADRPPCESVQDTCGNEAVCLAVYNPYCCTGPRQALCVIHRDKLLQTGARAFFCPCGSIITLIRVVPLCP